MVNDVPMKPSQLISVQFFATVRICYACLDSRKLNFLYNFVVNHDFQSNRFYLGQIFFSIFIVSFRDLEKLDFNGVFNANCKQTSAIRFHFNFVFYVCANVIRLVTASLKYNLYRKCWLIN